MRFSKGRVIALYGGTCVGKTTAAKHLAATLGWNLRDCGHEVVHAAERQGVAVRELPLDVHRSIDAETRLVTSGATDGMIVDGRYLQYVLAGMSVATMVEVTCDDKEADSAVR